MLRICEAFEDINYLNLPLLLPVVEASSNILLSLCERLKTLRSWLESAHLSLDTFEFLCVSRVIQRCIRSLSSSM